MREVKKTSIDQIGKEQIVTIAEHLITRSSYFIIPPITLEELASAFVDPSDVDDAKRMCYYVFGAHSKVRVTKPLREALNFWLSKTDALQSNAIYFADEAVFAFGHVKHKILKKFNINDLKYRTEENLVAEITIESRVPLFDPKAHDRHIQNMVRAVKLRHPNITLDLNHDGCFTGGSCSLGVKEALRKGIEQASGKVTEK